jgi:uncharacterized membrane protein YuzA (DUF378 family)
MVLEIDGQKEVKYLDAKKKEHKATLPALGALARMLAAKAEASPGAPAQLKVTRGRGEPPVMVEFTPRPGAIDPWQMRIGFAFEDMLFEPEETTVTAEGNPLLALYMGGEFIAQHLRLTYAAFMKMATREVGMQQMAGPVGIVGMAMEQAKVGWNELVFFLAYLSISLAVINFLPVPVLDGGLMVFLIIEKIKGKPLSFKTQMVSTLVGLAAILLIAVFVTIQDIGRIVG